MGKISASTFDKVIRREANPGLDFCVGVARAFSMPPDEVLRLAGLLPPKSEKDAMVEKIMYYWDQLSDANRETAIALLEALAKQSQPKPQAVENAGQSPEPATS